MQARRHNLSFARRSRSGFTMIELLTVVTIIAILVGISYVVLADSLVKARVEATRATIRQLDSALQERIDGFNRINFRPQAQQLQILYAAGGNTPPTISVELAELMIRKDRYRAAFPQREEDLYGFNCADDGGTGDDAPLLAIWDARVNVSNHQPETESSELLYLMLTEGGSFGLPSIGVDRFTTRHIGDTDNDGVPEFLDDWGRPLRFYNWTTRLIRSSSVSGAPDINRSFFIATVGSLMPDVIEPPSATLSSTAYNHPLNQDPDDPTGGFAASMSATGVFTSTFDLVDPISGALFTTGQPFNEVNYHTLDTYHIPLILSAGPDEELGLNEPTATGAARLALPLATGPTDTDALDPLYDNITNRQR